MTADLFQALESELRRIVREEVSAASPRPLPYYDKHDAAEYLRTTIEGIKGLVKRGELEPLRRKPYWLFTQEELDRVARSETA
jgi:hypothetical protein